MTWASSVFLNFSHYYNIPQHNLSVSFNDLQLLTNAQHYLHRYLNTFPSSNYYS